MFSVSGLRGIAGKDLNVQDIQRYALYFGRFLKTRKVIIGRDTRPSGVSFRNAVVQGLHAAGVDVIDLGIVPTPTVLFMVRRCRAGGGVAITASHNPIEWNALKFINRQGLFLNGSEYRSFKKYLLKQPAVKSKRQRRIQSVRNSIDQHISNILRIVPVRAPGVKVAVDAVNGAGSIALPRLLARMGCRVHKLHCRQSPSFPRKPEPLPDNIRSLSRIVREEECAIGFACDPDCDRLAIVDEHGHAIGEENTLAMAVDYVLGRHRGAVVTNYSTTERIEHVASKYGQRVYRTKVGEAHVVNTMMRRQAVIGGEGNGGVIFPRINCTRDALVGTALVMRLLTEKKLSVSRWCASYPSLYMIKKKLLISNKKFDNARKKIIRKFKGKVHYRDGLRISGTDFWLHMRPSQTEPLLRVIGEARERKYIEKLVKEIRQLLR